MKSVTVVAAVLMLAVPGVFGQARSTETAAQAAEAAPAPLGTVTVNGKSVPLRYVYAIRGPAFMDAKKEEIRIILSDVLVNPDELTSDFALMDRGRAGKVNGVVVRLDMEANADTGELYHSALGNLHMALYGAHQFKPTAFDGQRVAGTLFMPEPRKFEANTYHYTATFDVAIQRQADLQAQEKAATAAEAAKRVPPTAEESAAAAASGPGQVVSAYLKALLAQDIPALKKLAANPRMFADLEGPMGKMAMGMMGAVLLGTQVTRVNQTGDTAIVEVEGPNVPTPAKIPTVLISGEWKLADKDEKTAPGASGDASASSSPAGSAPPAVTEGIGNFTVGDKTVPLRHAYAFREPSVAVSSRDDVRIVLTGAPITFVEQESGAFAPAEAASLDEKEAGWRNRVEVTFDPVEKSQRMGTIYHGGPDAEPISVSSEFEPTVFDDERVAGKLSMYWPPMTINGIEVHYAATFDAAIQRSSQARTTTVRGAEAAATGPGKVLLAIGQAARAEDVEAFKSHLSEEFRKGVEDGAFQVGVLFQLLPSEEVAILSVTETGDEAVVACESGPAGERIAGEFTMVREAGEWKLKR